MHTHNPAPHVHRRASLRPMRTGKLRPMHPGYGSTVVRLGPVRLRNPLGLVLKLALILAALTAFGYAVAYLGLGARHAHAHDAPPPCHETPCEGEGDRS
jgi:hypothetical protein